MAIATRTSDAGLTANKALKILGSDMPLRIDEAGFGLLRQRLEAANRGNSDFSVEAGRLLGATRQAIDGLLRCCNAELEVRHGSRRMGE